MVAGKIAWPPQLRLGNSSNEIGGCSRDCRIFDWNEINASRLLMLLPVSGVQCLALPVGCFKSKPGRARIGLLIVEVFPRYTVWYMLMRNVAAWWNKTPVTCSADLNWKCIRLNWKWKGVKRQRIPQVLLWLHIKTVIIQTWNVWGFNVFGLCYQALGAVWSGT